ncbi:MAG: L,D-transpeptidase family protein [Candidatus Obscuribacterales bacterium]|nr:L,D-transpeptidase family protein [Candidatus Obscuribacterales bacterium]
MHKVKILLIALLLLGLLSSLLLWTHPEVFNKVQGKEPRTLAHALADYAKSARKRMASSFQKSDIDYPPSEITIIALKKEKRLEIYCPDSDNNQKLVLEYPILAASGDAGPKLKQGDFQVPEGFYKIEAFNPNSRFHLSLRINYPNDFDRLQSQKEKRKDLGGDIMIHGDACSIGCIAIGDEKIEELFTLVSDVKRKNTKLLIAPCDLRVEKPEVNFKYQPDWLPALYKDLKKAMLAVGADNKI